MHLRLWANFLRRTKFQTIVYGRGLLTVTTRTILANVRRSSLSYYSFSCIANTVNNGGSALPTPATKLYQQDLVTGKQALKTVCHYSKMATSTSSSSSGFATTNAALGEQKSVEVCRLMGPQDANISGNVHGGVILKMIEQAGLIVSTRHCNVMRRHESTSEDEFEQCVAGLVRVEKTDFVQPMYIGEVAQLHAEITHTAYHSMEVQVRVWAEDVMHGKDEEDKR